MNNGHRPPNHSHSSPEEHAKLVRANLFRKHLRDADKSILEGNFDKAWLQLAEAAKLEPNHQMLVAFKERLEHVQQKTSASDPSPPAAAPTTESGINPESIGKNGNGRADGTIPAGESRPVSAAEPLAPPPAATNTAFEAASQALNEVQSELDTLRRALEGECEKGVKLEKELSDARGTEQELRKKFETERAEAQERLKTETAAALEAEQKRHEQEKADLLKTKEQEFQELSKQLLKEMEQKLAQEIEKSRQEFDRKLELLGVKISQSKDERLARYREKLKHVYESGTPSADGEQMLQELRKLLQVTPEEHHLTESDVRLALYVEHVEKGIRSGEFSQNLAGGIEELKKRYCITPEESSRLEPYILSTFQQLAVKGRILLVDDDQLILTSLGRILTDYGFQVIQCTEVEAALEKLQSNQVDFIVSDIKFASGELEGFKFFEMVAEQPQLRDIPFVFMSALQDSFIVRSGAKLGADDYLLKPVEPDLLIAIIEGKMKRYHHSRQRSAQSQAS
jgi:CheY-like chemotaxis protein